MFKVNIETYKQNCIQVHKRQNKSILWIKIHYIRDKLGVETCFI